MYPGQSLQNKTKISDYPVEDVKKIEQSLESAEQLLSESCTVLLKDPGKRTHPGFLENLQTRSLWKSSGSGSSTRG